MARQTIDLSPERIDYIWVRGDTWDFELAFPESTEEDAENVDLGDSTWLAQIRPADADGAIDLTADVFAVFDVDTANQSPDGILYLVVESDITETAVPGTFYWYDIQQTRDGKTVTPVQGRITVKPDVSVEED